MLVFIILNFEIWKRGLDYFFCGDVKNISFYIESIYVISSDINIGFKIMFRGI